MSSAGHKSRREKEMKSTKTRATATNKSKTTKTTSPKEKKEKLKRQKSGDKKRQHKRQGSASAKKRRRSSSRREFSVDDFEGMGAKTSTSRISVSVPRQSSMNELITSAPQVAVIDDGDLEIERVDADKLLKEIQEEKLEDFFSDQDDTSKGDNKKKKEEGKPKSKESPKKQHAGKKRDSGKQEESSTLKTDVDSSSAGKIDKRLTSDAPAKNPIESDSDMSVRPISSVLDWSEQDVANWVKSLPFKESKEYSKQFLRGAVDGKLLLELDVELLMDLGVKRKIHCKRFKTEISNMRKELSECDQVGSDIPPEMEAPKEKASDPEPVPQAKEPEEPEAREQEALRSAKRRAKTMEKKNKETEIFPTNRPISDNYSMHDLNEALTLVFMGVKSIQEKAVSRLISFADIPDLVQPLIDQLNHVGAESMAATTRDQHISKEKTRSSVRREPSESANISSKKKPVTRQDSAIARKILKQRHQKQNEKFTQRAFIDAVPFEDLSLKFDDVIEDANAEELKITFAQKPPGFLMDGGEKRKGAIVKSVLNHSTCEGLTEGMHISKIGHVSSLHLTFHEVHSLISNGQYPLEITFVKLAHDPFEGVMEKIPYPSDASKDESSGFGNFDDDKPNLYNSKTQLPNHDAFVQAGSAVCRTKLKRGKWSLIRLNIDNMKILCERYGQDAGDTTVKKMAANIHSNLRTEIPHSLFFHLFSDDFAIIAPCKDEDTIFKQMDIIRTTISKTPIEIVRNKKKRKRIKLSITCGLSLLGPGMRFNQWKKACESALAAGKKQGKNRIIRVSRSQISSNKWSQELYTNLKNFIGMNNSEYLLRMIKRLLNNGASLDYQDPTDKKTPLMLALQSEEREVIEELLKHQFDGNLQNTTGKTTLMIALEYNWDDDVVQNLLQRNFDPALVDELGNSALTIAYEKDRQQVVASILRLQGMKVSAEQAERFPNLLRNSAQT